MAIYTTFFLCEPDELAEGFPGWKAPLTKARTVEQVNPFTGTKSKTSTRAPDWTKAEEQKYKPPKPRVVNKAKTYEAYLENRIPPFVQSRPRWCAKGLTPLELAPLVAQVLKADSALLDSALFAPPKSGASLEVFPDKFVAALSKAKAADKKRLAKAWAATEEMAMEETTPAIALSILEELVALAAQHSKGQRLYLLTEV